MPEPRDQTPGPDDTAAFQRFYSAGDRSERAGRGLFYRLLIGWWRDRK